MKKVISFAVVAPLILSSFVSAAAQQGAQQPTAKGESKSQNVGAPNLSASSSPQSAAGSPAGVESSRDTRLEQSLEAQKHYESGIALSDAGRFEEAVAAFKQSLKLRPEDAQTSFILGMTYSKSKLYREAFDSFKRAVQYKPNWPEAHFRLGMMAYVLGRKSESLEQYKKLVELNSSFAGVLYRIIKDETTALGPAENDGTGGQGSAPTNLGTVSSKPAPVDTNKNQITEAQPSSGNSNGEPSNPGGSSLPTSDSDNKPVVSDQPLTEIYRVGVGDVLDVRFLNSPNSRSTLFTVIGGGVIDLPVAGGPIAVSGLTVDEIQARVAAELKRRAVAENAQVSVAVRQYTSHSVTVTGLVVNPGMRFLRREAVPLYVILAESQLRNDAGRVVIMRGGTTAQTLDLSDTGTLNVNVRSGDVITVASRPQEFYYIAGRINYPGQKLFQPGITLLQAILAAGGTSRNEVVEISRERSDGRLITTRFNIKEIKSGTVKDPKVNPGDRIEVIR